MPEVRSQATVAAALSAARAAGLDRLDAQLLLAHQLGRSRSWLLAHDDETMSGDAARAYLDDVQRRADGVPLAYLVGRREFHGLTFRVTPDVLVPRPDTETLVDWAIELLRGPLAGLACVEVVDLGCGSGAIALTVKSACATARVRAIDVSPAALAVARQNGCDLGLEVEWLLGDWWSALPPAPRVHLALANPPYIAQDDPHLTALRHEPISALASGVDGLRDLRSIIKGAAAHLQVGAWLLLEHGYNQSEAVCRLLTEQGFQDVVTRHDLSATPRCSGGRWAGP